MAFILRSSKHVYNFLGLARRGGLACRRKKVSLLENNNIFKYNELLARTAATAPKAILANSFSVEKNVNNLHNNVKANMVDLYTVNLTLQLIKESGAMTPAQLTLLLKCCGSVAYKDSEEQKIKMAKNIWETAKDLGLEFDISHFNTLLNVFVENSYKFSPKKILAEIQKSGLQPNQVTYRRLLKGFCQQGDIQGAGDLLEEMKKIRYPINEYDFCSLIQGHCEAGEMEEANKILNVMKERGITPSLEPYVYLLCGYAKHGRINEMHELLDSLSQQDRQMTDSYLLNIVYSLIINNQHEHVDPILSKMSQRSDYERTLMKVVYRLLHKNKDEEALKVFEVLTKAGYSKDYIMDKAHGIIEHFVFNRNPNELVHMCNVLQERGYTNTAYSVALKKAVLRKDLNYCIDLMRTLKRNKFPMRPHFFWPLIARYAEQGNQGVLSVVEAMKMLPIIPCSITVKNFVRPYYKFDKNWKADISAFTKSGIKECYATLITLGAILGRGELKEAEELALNYGIYKPGSQTINDLVKCFSKSCPQEEERFLNVLYALAHDFHLYKTNSIHEGNENEEEVAGLNNFFELGFNSLMTQCSEDVFLSVLQNASKKKLMVTPVTAESIRSRFSNPDVDALLKEFTDSNEFELDQELLAKKSENFFSIGKANDTNSLFYVLNHDPVKAEQVYAEIGSKATVEEHLAMLNMYVNLNNYDKAFKVIESLKNCQGDYSAEFLKCRRFRICYSLLRNSNSVEELLKVYNVGVSLGLLNESNVQPLLYSIFKNDDSGDVIQKYFGLFDKIRTVTAFIFAAQHFISTNNTTAVEQLTTLFARSHTNAVANTALLAAYCEAGRKEEALRILDNRGFRFQPNIFYWWFKIEFQNPERTFEEATEIIKMLPAIDRTQGYHFLLSKFGQEKDYDGIKKLWVEVQEDTSADPFFLEHLRRYVQNIEKGNTTFENLEKSKGQGSFQRFSSRPPRVEESEYKKMTGKLITSILDSRPLKKLAHSLLFSAEMVRTKTLTKEVLDSLLAGKLPFQLANKMLPILAAEGRISEVFTVINKYRLYRHVPEITSEILKANKTKEFLELVSLLASTKKFGAVFNSFASQEERILNLIKADETFFNRSLELATQCYEESGYEALLVFFIKLCVQLPDKLSKAEELLNKFIDIVSHFRNYTLSNMLLSTTQQLDFYQNVLNREKIKSVFSETLDRFYERVISIHNQNGDMEKALLYLDKAKADGVDGKLDKRLLNLLKKNLEEKGSSFPYPELLQEAA